MKKDLSLSQIKEAVMKRRGVKLAQIKNTIYPDTAQNDINHLLGIIQAEKRINSRQALRAYRVAWVLGVTNILTLIAWLS